MKSPISRRRLSLAALLAVVALTFTACGADGDDEADSTTTTEAEATTTTTEAESGDDETTTTEAESGDDETTTTTEAESGDDETTTTEGSGSGEGINGMAKDMVVDQYKKMGMTQEQADCAADLVLDKMGDSGSMGSMAEIGQELMSKCDINPGDLSLGGNN